MSTDTEAPAAPAPVPSDASVVRTASKEIGSIKFTIRTLSTKGLFRVVKAIERMGIVIAPPTISVVSFCTDAQRARLQEVDDEFNLVSDQLKAAMRAQLVDGKRPEVDSEAVRDARLRLMNIMDRRSHMIEQWTADAPRDVLEAINDTVKGRVRTMMHYALGAEDLLYALLGAVTDRSEADWAAVGDDLAPHVVLEILNQAFDLIPLTATVEAAFGFFSRSSALMVEYGKANKKFNKKE